MGRLDRIHTANELIDESEFDELDELEPVDDLFNSQQMGDIEKAFSGFHPEAMKRLSIPKDIRRTLEDKLEEVKLRHQINDYDYKI